MILLEARLSSAVGHAAKVTQMTTKRLTFLLVAYGAFFIPLAKTKTAQEAPQTFRPPPIRDMYVSWEGQPIGEIGLKPRELTDMLSRLLSTLSHGAGADLRSPAALEKKLLARHVDMGEGVDKGLDVHGRDELCGASGNCATWFFRRSHEKWILVLGGTWPGAFAFIPPKHNGLLDLVLVMHLSAAEAPTDVWQFNGTKFELLKSYCMDGDGQSQEGKCP
jgi:hypothetical protein